jgi:hypothetical protein
MWWPSPRLFAQSGIDTSVPVNPTNPIVLNITNGVPQTNSILGGGIIYYQVNVPANADFATNSLLFTLNGPLNVWFTTNAPPTIDQCRCAALMPDAATNGLSILSTTSVPTNIVPGATYYLGVQNTNSFAVTYGIEVDFHLLADQRNFHYQHHRHQHRREPGFLLDGQFHAGGVEHDFEPGHQRERDADQRALQFL